MRRVAYLEDPAQLDPGKRHLGIDGLRQDDQAHRCFSGSSRVANPDAFATAFARGVEHPKVREALEMPFDLDKMPKAVAVPIADLLGPDGHHFMFEPNSAVKRYAIATMFPRPIQGQSADGQFGIS